MNSPIHNPKKLMIMWLLSTLFAALIPFAPPKISVSEAKGLKDLKQPLESPSPWHISADRLSYEEEKGLYMADGHVVIEKEGQILYADSAVYNKKTGIAKVRGNVRMETGGDFVSGTEGVFDLRNQTGRLKNARIFLKENHYYISGSLFERLDKDTYLVKDCSITTCDGQRPAWSFSAAEVRVTIEGYGTARNATFRIKNIPTLYLPYIIFPAKAKRQTGLLPPRAGYSSRNGLDVEIPFFWAISDQTDATFYERYMTERGYMQGVEFRYVQKDNSNGVLLLDILSDNREKDMNDPDDVSLSPYKRTNETRYWIRGRADQNLPFDMDLRLDGDYVSDQDYLKEFTGGLFGFEARPDLVSEWGRPLEERYSALRRSALLVNKPWDQFVFQASSQFYERPEHPSQDDTAQPLVGLHFEGVSQKLWRSPLFIGISSDYNYVWRDYGDKGHHGNITPRLQWPLMLGRYLEFIPYVQYTYDIQWLDRVDGGTARDSSNAYKTGMRLASRFEKIFNLPGHTVKRLRHSIWPVLTYEYGSFRHGDAYSPWFSPIVEQGQLNRVAFSLENYLDAKIKRKAGYQYTQWASLNITQGFDIREHRREITAAQKRKPWEPLTASFRLQPMRYIDLYGTAKWDHYEHRFSQTDVSLKISWDRSGGKTDLIRVEYQSLMDEYKNISLWADINMAYGFSTGGALKRALDESVDISKALWLKYQSQCWGIKITAEKENQETKYMVFFELKGLGEIRAW